MTVSSSAIETRGLTTYYGKHQADVDRGLQAPRGVVWGFPGGNGAGKTVFVLDLGRYAVFANTFALVSKDQVVGGIGRTSAHRRLLCCCWARPALATLFARWRDALRRGCRRREAVV